MRRRYFVLPEHLADEQPLSGASFPFPLAPAEVG
jgi:hypothetical protein